MTSSRPLVPGIQPLRGTDPHAIGGYQLRGRLGSGGQGVVYLSKDDQGRPVAVKVLAPTTDPKVADRFQKEVAAARRVARFCCARVLDAGIDEQRPYIVSEYIDGPSLQELVEQQGPRTGAALDRIAAGTATALAAIHAAGLVHRDFKPANVLMGPDGPVVIDFGLAAVPGMTTQLTGPATLGTPAFMAPEQLAGERGTTAADIWAWAVTMTYVASGKLPFTGDTFSAMAFAILHRAPSLASVPEPFAALVSRCLDREPSRRPAARQVLDSLLAAATAPAGQAEAATVRPADSPAVSAQQALAGQRARLRRWLTGAAAAVLAAAVAMAPVEFPGAVAKLVQAVSGPQRRTASPFPPRQPRPGTVLPGTSTTITLLQKHHPALLGYSEPASNHAGYVYYQLDPRTGRFSRAGDSVAISPGGWQEAYPVGQQVTIVDLHTGQHRTTAALGHTPEVPGQIGSVSTPLQFSPDGRSLMVVTGSSGNRVRVVIVSTTRLAFTRFEIPLKSFIYLSWLGSDNVIVDSPTSSHPVYDLHGHWQETLHLGQSGGFIDATGSLLLYACPTAHGGLPLYACVMNAATGRVTERFRERYGGIGSAPGIEGFYDSKDVFGWVNGKLLVWDSAGYTRQVLATAHDRGPASPPTLFFGNRI